MDELLEQFLIEGRELVQQASDDLLELERAPGDAARIDSVFRAFHTLKGSAGLFDLAPLQATTHAAEDLIGALRAGQIPVGRPMIDLLLGCVGEIEGWIAAVARSGGLPPGAAARGAALAQALRAPLGIAHAPAPQVAPAPSEWRPALLARHQAGGPHLTAIRYTPAADCFFLGDDPLALLRTVPGLVALSVTGREPWTLADFDPFACNLVIEALTTAPVDDVALLFRLVADQVVIEAAVAAPAPDEPGAEAIPDPAQRTLRVDAARIDAMVDIAGELIVAKNALAHVVGRITASQEAAGMPGLAQALVASHGEIDRLVGRMHRAVMGARMVPLDQTTRRFPRLVRDIAARLDRPVQFEITGAQTEADKAIADGLYEPLLHMLRNAIDHGIEPAARRAAAGKPAQGRIGLDIAQAGGQIAITVTDDGAGIDPARLRAAAKSRGVASDAAVDALDDEAVLDLLFAPGFSTASAVTDISGRGMGMDAVRTAVQALGGQAAIASVPGQGTTIRLTLPQAVALTTIIVVRVGAERFGVPIQCVVETARVPRAAILAVHGGAAFVLRDRTIPLLHLAALLRLKVAPDTGGHAKILVVTIGDHQAGLVVDGFEDRSDVLLRPLGGLLAGMPGVMGAALMGDGQVLMVLDVPGLAG